MNTHKKSGLADSPFFKLSTNPAKNTEDSNVRTPERVNGRTPEHANARTGEHPKSPSGKRVNKRQSYNVYVDQHEALKRLEATSKLSGKPRFLSEMVREAIDDYLKKHQ